MAATLTAVALLLNARNGGRRTVMNIVFRVQDAEGRGPWKSGFSQLWVEDRSEFEYAALKPWPVEFGPVHLKALYGMHLGCGCTSLDQLRRWFMPTEYARLRSFGYRAVEMRVEHVLAESSIQCVFERVKPLAEDVKIVELYHGCPVMRLRPGSEVDL